MCSPAFAFTSALGIAGGYAQSQAERHAAASKQSYYNFLASQNETQAATVLKRGEQQATAISGESAVNHSNAERGFTRVVGSQRAALGASGVSADSVTAEDIARDSNRTHTLDMTALRYDADSKVWAAKTAATDQATSLRNQAAGFRMAGRNAVDAGNLNAGATLLGTATSVADNWYRYGQTGAGRTPGTVKVRSNPSGRYSMAPDYGNA